ncbi:hypothetical protein T03_14558 [Trichinella britovi]|uniref:Uncharacterized protein n=1 Tax=Trichinella britovi TaxID=45882 RepID=A0A0V1CUQ9_TRIBR|nr:hypothetical protein T03_14558 [Trichinella britovi]
MCRIIPRQYQPWDSEFLSQSLIWHLRLSTVGRIGHEDRRPITVVVVLTCVRWSWQVEGSVFGLSSSSVLPFDCLIRYILIVCRLMVAMPSGKRETEVRKGNASVNTSLSPNGDGRANNLVEEADGHSRGSGPLQITATGEQVTSCYNIGNGPRPSRTPLALGFCRSYGIYEFDVTEDDSSIFLPVFLTDARVESEFIGYCCTLPSVESITGFVAYAEKNKFIFGFLDDKYDVACAT